MTLCAVAADIGVFLIEALWTKPKIKSNKKVTITLSKWCIEMCTGLEGWGGRGGTDDRPRLSPSED